MNEDTSDGTPAQDPGPGKVCGFRRARGVVAFEAVRDGIVAQAIAEGNLWVHNGKLQKETDSGRIADLVRYWLAGRSGHGDIRPDTLVAAQNAAKGLSYTELLAGFATSAVAAHVRVDKDADDAAEALLARWDDLDDRRRKLAAAEKKEKEARRAKAKGEAAAKAARAEVARLTKPGPPTPPSSPPARPPPRPTPSRRGPKPKPARRRPSGPQLLPRSGMPRRRRMMPG